MLLNPYIKLVQQTPRAVIAVMLFLLLPMAWFTQDFKLDASADSLVVEGDADLEFSRLINERYGTSDFLFIAYQPREPLFSELSLARLASLRDELATMPRVESVNTMLDVPLLRMANVPLTELADNILTLQDEGIDLIAAREDLVTNQAYRNALISEDGATTALIVNFQRDQVAADLLNRRSELRNLRDTQGLDRSADSELREVSRQYSERLALVADLLHQDIATIRATLAGYRHDADIVMGGVPMIADDLITFVRNDLINFGSAILAFIILALSFLFRRIRYVAVPLLCCAFTAIYVIGLLGLFDWRVTVISSNFISLLLIITISLTVHLMVRYRELQQQDPSQSHQDLLTATLRSMSRPCAYTSLTTIVAFASLLVSGIPPVISFGQMMVVGVALTFITTFMLFPAIMTLLPAVPVPPPAHRKGFELTPLLARFTDRRGGVVLTLFAALLLMGVTGLARLKVENSFIDYFDRDTEIYRGMVSIDRNMGGTTPLDVIIDLTPPGAATGFGADDWDDDDYFDDFDDDFDDDFEGSTVTRVDERAYWFTSDKMRDIIAIHDWLDALPETGKVLSLGTLIKLAHELNDNRPLGSIELAVLYGRIPDEFKETLLQPYVSVENNQVRFNIRVRESDPNLVRGELLRSIRDGLVENFNLQPEQVHLTGMLVLYNNMLQSLFESQIETLALVLAMIMVMFMVLFRSWKLAVIGIIPNILAAGAVLGIMGWLGIPLDMMTITIAAISVGIGVDNTIHYIHRFKDRFPLHGNYLATMHDCHGSIGRAMYYTSFTIVVGFSILVLSNFIPTIYFGLLTSLAMMIALAGALTLLPKLLVMFRPLGAETRSAA
jgi:uncharacterized protein